MTTKKFQKPQQVPDTRIPIRSIINGVIGITIVAAILFMGQYVNYFAFLLPKEDFKPSRWNDSKNISLRQSLPSDPLSYSVSLSSSCGSFSRQSNEATRSAQIVFDKKEFISLLDISINRNRKEKSTSIVTELEIVKSYVSKSDNLDLDTLIKNPTQKLTWASREVSDIMAELVDTGKATVILPGNNNPELSLKIIDSGFVAAPLVGEGYSGYQLQNGEYFWCRHWIT